MQSVLIVDDNPSDRALFRHILSRGGYAVIEVARGLEAVAKAREVRPQAVVLDVNLPDIDGHAVCRALRDDRELAGVPVLMLTVRDNDHDVLQGLEAGADDYVAKDSAPEIVLARVRRLIQFRQLASVAALNEHLVQVGRLLAGIVHEIRTPLSVILTSADMMRIQLGPDNPNMQWVDPILRNARLLKVRLEHLMATVRGGPAEVQVLDVVPVIHEAAELFRKGADPRGGPVAIEEHTTEPMLTLRADPGHLILVLLNLFSNARDAILERGAHGNIFIRTGLVHDEGRDWVRIEVADDGPGIPEEVVEHIFEPFFTTKKTGTGFGLYLSSELIRGQDGRLTVCNRPEGGACFAIWLAHVSEPVLAGIA